MEAFRDLSWVRHLMLPSIEQVELRGFRLAIVTVPATAAHHADRFRYRLLAIDPSLGRPILSVDLESDILGDYCLSVQLAAEHRIIARYDDLPTVEEFRQRALAEADRWLPAMPGEGAPAAASEGPRGRSQRPNRGGRRARQR